MSALINPSSTIRERMFFMIRTMGLSQLLVF